MDTQGPNTNSFDPSSIFAMDPATHLAFQHADQTSTFHLGTPATAHSLVGNGQSPETPATEEDSDFYGLDVVQPDCIEVPDSDGEEAELMVPSTEYYGAWYNNNWEAPIPSPFSAEPPTQPQPEGNAGIAGPAGPSVSQTIQKSRISRPSYEYNAQPGNFEDDYFTAQQPNWTSPRDPVSGQAVEGGSQYQAQTSNGFEQYTRPRHSNLRVPRTMPPANQARVPYPYTAYGIPAEADATSFIPGFGPTSQAGHNLSNSRKRSRGAVERDEQAATGFGYNAPHHEQYHNPTWTTAVTPHAANADYLGGRADLGYPDINSAPAEKRRRLPNGQASRVLDSEYTGEEHEEDDFSQDEDEYVQGGDEGMLRPHHVWMNEL